MPKPDLTDPATLAKAWEVFDSLPDGTTKAEARALIDEALATPDLPPEPTVIGTLVLFGDQVTGSVWRLEDLTTYGHPGQAAWMVPSFLPFGGGQSWAALCALGTPQVLRPVPPAECAPAEGAHRG